MNLLDSAKTKRPSSPEGRVRLLEGMLGLRFYEGNEIRSLCNGNEIFPAMLEAIEEAERSIDFLTFVYWTGEIADRFAEALARKAAGGLRVRILLDAFGARSIRSELVERLRESGAELHFFRPLQWRIWRAVHRTHRKILVCDDAIGFTGGVGIAEEWMGRASDPSEWRDTHFEIRGPAVLGLRGSFLGNWLECVNVSEMDLKPPELPQAVGSASIQVIRSSASVDWSEAAHALRVCLAQAQRRLRITTAYFVPDPASVELLVLAAQRGVEVEIMLPGKHTDSRVTRWGAEDRFGELLAAGVRIFSYERTMLHAKVLTVDGEMAAIGSANFNHRSLSEDDEVLLVVLDKTLVKSLDRDFDNDLESCRELDLDTWRARSGYQRLRELLARLVRRRI